MIKDEIKQLIIDTLDLEDLERYAASDTLSDRICFTAQTEESVDIVRFVDFLQEEDAVSLSNIFVEGYGKAGAYALVAAAIDNRISAVAVYAPGCPDYTGADTPQYSNLWTAASKLKTPLLFGVDINGTDVTALMAIGKLKGLYIVSSSWNDRARELNADIEKYINGGGRQYEELIRVRQDSEDVAMYYWSPDGVQVGEFLMVNKLVFSGNGQVFRISIIQFEAEDLKLADLIKVTLDIAKEN